MAKIARSYFDKDVPKIVLQSLFKKYDKSETGVLSLDEIRELLHDDLGMKKDQTDAYIMILDRDGNKSVSFDELHTWLKSGERFKHISDNTRYYHLNEAVKYFNKFDTDGSGTIERDEFTQLMLSINYPPEHIPGALHHLDTDGDGKISFDEFLKWLNWT